MPLLCRMNHSLKQLTVLCVSVICFFCKQMNIYTSRISSSILRLQYISPWCQIFLFLADTKCKVFYTLYTHCIDRRRRKWIFKFWIQLYIYSILTAACLPLRHSIIPICICKKILLAHQLLYNLNLLNYRFCPLIIKSIENTADTDDELRSY